MATAKIKTTYSLDVDVVRILEEMARRWQVSKSEALGRAIRIAANETPTGASEAERALDALQSAVALSETDAASWVADIRRERNHLLPPRDE